MALFALYHAKRPGPLGRHAVNDWIAGNLCRCTGYRPIVDAAIASCGAGAADRFFAQEPDVLRTLAALDGDEDVFVGSDERFFAAPAIPTPCWSAARPTSACGSPSNCAKFRRSYGSAVCAASIRSRTRPMQ
jgi:hypothetical protein